MSQRVKPWQVGLGVIVAALFVVAMGVWALRPAPIRAQAPPGKNPIHYEIELGPREGQLERLQRAGVVPPDAIDNGKGSFVSPSALAPAELEYAKRIVRERELRRAARSRR
ncbi:MAG: hypothetical protein K0Q72_4655 [Armatimonadetes bacterium]|jgi:hypothetical protein|nr:hypothetical protein [Armatimonadota bacterium]